MASTLVAGSRESQLAIAQTHLVMDWLKSHHPGLTLEMTTMKTKGDLFLQAPLSAIGDKGLFVKELEDKLLAGDIDFAVHSMKDMPSRQPEGCQLIAVGKREMPWDVLVSISGKPLEELPKHAIVGSSSLRRQAMIKAQRPDVQVKNIRGNVQTRLRKLEEEDYDAIVLAGAGLHRLDLEDRITQVFDPTVMLPACCQGILAVEFVNPELQALFAPLMAPEVTVAMQAERAFLKRLEGGCRIPMAAYAQRLDNAQYEIHGALSDAQGETMLKASETFLPEGAAQAGERLANTILAQGGRQILEELGYTALL